MMNSIILVGKLNDIRKENNKFIITIASTRHTKDESGDYPVDLIDFETFGGVGNTAMEYCKKGDTIGIRGKIQTEMIEGVKVTKLIAERISFLSTNPDLKKEDE